MFLMGSIREFKKSLQNWGYATIVVIIVGVRGGGNNKGEKQLLIVDGKGEFDQNAFALGNNFKT
jgi:hypothetical protein